jgi:hypothetical protein
MLITEEPPRLKNFPGTKPFDLFICVEGESGSRILRSIEDPSHTRFEFDRITDLEERTRAETAYILFAKEIRELIKEHAAMDASQEVFIDDLNDFFSGAETPSIDDGRTETSNKLTLDPIRKAKPFRPSNVGSASGEDAADDQLPGSTPGDVKAGEPGGTGATDFSGSSSSTGKKFEISLGDPRVVHIPGKRSKIFFSLDHVGPFTLSIGKVGELESQLLKYRSSADAEWKVKGMFNCSKKGARVSIEVELEPGAEKYALQLVAHNV